MNDFLFLNKYQQINTWQYYSHFETETDTQCFVSLQDTDCASIIKVLRLHFAPDFFPIYNLKMSKPCAYCKELGHHIRECTVLKEKNRRQEPVASSDHHLRKSPKKVEINLSKTKNVFSDLYSSSSDEEIEEGEIVEVDRLTRYVTTESESDSDSMSSSESNWARKSTNCKIIYIPCVKKQEEIDEYVHPVYNYEPCPFLEKYNGMSWAEIEYYSEDE